MTTSESINELATALSKAQGQIKGAIKDAENPHFRSRYADLASVWDACRDALSKNGLSIIQGARATACGDGGWTAEVETRLLHNSGQWIADALTMPVGKADAHGITGAVTYARRMGLAAMVGVAPEDDDGNAAVLGSSAKPASSKAKPAPEGFGDWLDELTSVADEGTPALEAAWKASHAEYRQWATTVRAADWAAIKARAAKVVL